MFRSAAAAAGLLSALVTALPLRAAGTPVVPVAYEEGYAAYDNGEYDTAVAKLRKALEADQVESVGKYKQSKALNKIDYLPHFYLGMSYDKLGKVEEAYRELKLSQGQGVIRERSSLNRILESALGRLEARLRPPTQAPPPPTAVIARALPTATAVPKPPPTAVAVAHPTATPRRAEPPPPTAAVIAAQPTERPAVKATPAEEEEGISTTVMAGVREGIRSFFKGDYQVAIRQLTPHVELVPLARLFLSYSLAATELLKPQRDPVAVERARREYAAAKKDGAPTRNEDLISPSVRALLK